MQLLRPPALRLKEASAQRIEIHSILGRMASMNPLPLLLLLATCVASSDADFIFVGFGGANLSRSGIAEITPDGLLRLTNNTKEAEGQAFYPLPFHFKNNLSDGNPLSFSTTFVFAIQPEYPDVSGHGIAFALSPSKDLPGAMPSQHLGLFNDTNNGDRSNHIVAVEIDTVKSVEYEDSDDNHVGIDINGLRSVNSSPAAYFDEQNGGLVSLRLISGDPMQVWVEYDGVSMRLDVTISPAGVPKPNVPIVSSKVNLSSIVSDDMYVGFTASTGAATSSHYVLGWSFNLNGNARPLDLSKLPSLPYQGAPGNKSQVLSLLTVALPLATVIVLLISIAGVVLAVRRKKKFAELLEDWEVEFGPHRFSYKDLFKATKGFRREQLLGVGGFGEVYKGVMPASRIEIAVKKISHDSRQGMNEFVAEIASMGRLRHRNLVQLLGYCRRRGQLLLVYEFMPNSSLDKLLFDEEKPAPSWSRRFGIIRGVASGLLYLHEGWEQVVIHRDIKSGNVLLDGELNAKLGDFGLARLHDHGSNPQTTRIVGTLGYLAPELSKTGKASTGTDVYAFGAFLLEVACGRRPVEFRASSSSEGEAGLVDLVLGCWKRGAILEGGDSRLGSDYVAREMELVLKLGLICSHPDPMARPSMRQVVQFLEGDAPLPSVTPAGLSACLLARQYDESFDEFVMSYPSTSDNTFLADSSPIFSKSH